MKSSARHLHRLRELAGFAIFGWGALLLLL